MDTVAHNGGDPFGEFINWHLVRYREKNNLSFTRSRPYMKNDNAYVEQKNNTHIRKLLGYERFDNFAQLKLMNDLCRNEWRLFSNFFRPVMKIERKEKVNNSLCRKIYDTAKTPYQRLMESSQISQEQKTELRELYVSLNPVQLKNSINEKARIIRKSAGQHSKIINVPTVTAKITLFMVQCGILWSHRICEFLGLVNEDMCRYILSLMGHIPIPPRCPNLPPSR